MHNLTLIITNALTSNHSQSFFIIIIIGGRLGDFARMLFISSLLVMIIMIIINPMINVLIMINMINHDQNRDLYQYGDHDQNGDNVMLIISTVLISTIMTIVIKLWSKWWSLEAERGGCAGDRGFSGRRATRWDAFQGSWSSLPSSPLFSSSSALLSSWWHSENQRCDYHTHHRHQIIFTWLSIPFEALTLNDWSNDKNNEHGENKSVWLFIIPSCF